jgi:SnoaL-like polyketide cyclase
MTPGEGNTSLTAKRALSLYQKIAELHHEKDLARVALTFTEDVIYEDDGALEPARGHAGIEQQFASVWRAFPDFEVELTGGPYLAEGTPAFAVRGRISGTMKGPLEPPGLAPTMAPVSTDFAGFYQAQGDRVSYARIILNTTDLAIQLGATPPPGSAAERWGLRLQRLQAWRTRRKISRKS